MPNAWTITKNALLDGLEDTSKLSMEEVFDHIVRHSNDPRFMKIVLPIARRMYPCMSYTPNPKNFADRLIAEIPFTRDGKLAINEYLDAEIQGVMKRDGTTEYEAVAMALMAQYIMEDFEKELI